MSAVHFGIALGVFHLVCFTLGQRYGIPDLMDIDYIARMAKTLDLNGERAFYEEDAGWERMANMLQKITFKQAAAVALDSTNIIYLLHRGDNVWDMKSFDEKYVYRNGQKDIIKGSPIQMYDPNTGASVPVNISTNRLVLPHGIYFDQEDNLWIVDVALHQVFMFKSDAKNRNEPVLTLGEAFKPGSGPGHFCQPTDVVRRNNLVFIADGYCNSRIAVFHINGTFIKEFGKPMEVVHSVTLSEESDLVCATNREGGEIVCFSAGIKNETSLGEYRFTIRRNPGERIFSAKARSVIMFGASIKPQLLGGEGMIFVQELNPESDPAAAITFEPTLGRIGMPHSMAVSEDLRQVYVVDADAEAVIKIYKFLLHQ